MRKALIACGLAAAFAAPAAAAVTPTDERNASRECRAERGDTPATQQAFAEKYGTNANDANAFGKCVSQKAREEAAERKAARKQAKKQCESTRANGRSAFRRCVNRKAKTIERRQDAADLKAIDESKNAAKECDAERGDTPETQEAFTKKYGTNKNKRNAFGKCVSGKTHEP